MRRGRFAPTPSGPLHLGHVRTALLAWLQMRKSGGTFILRMEDLDQSRSRPAYAKQILEDLRWLGLDWDEGPDVGGPHAPYAQSGRLADYRRALNELERHGALYPCFCSRADLATLASAPHGLTSAGPVYTGACRRLSASERAARSLAKQPALRFAWPTGRTVAFFDDALCAQRFAEGCGGDFVVRRADGVVAYQLAVVVDDIAMGVTDVLRASDLLDSTPRQILLYEALGRCIPRFAHIPLVLGGNGARLAKRHGAAAVAQLRAAGVAPQRIIGWLAWKSRLIDRDEPVEPRELVDCFDLSRVPRTPLAAGPLTPANL